MVNPLLKWRKSATPQEWLQLARKAGTTPGYLNLVAYGYRNASPRLAHAIELATLTFAGKACVSKESLVFGRKETGG